MERATKKKMHLVDIGSTKQLHVTPTAGKGRGVVAGAQGTTMSGSRQLLEEPSHIRMRGTIRRVGMGLHD